MFHIRKDKDLIANNYNFKVLRNFNFVPSDSEAAPRGRHSGHKTTLTWENIIIIIYKF